MSLATFTQDPGDGVNVGTLLGSQDHEDFDLTHGKTPNVDLSITDVPALTKAVAQSNGRDASASHDSNSRESVLPTAFGLLNISKAGDATQGSTANIPSGGKGVNDQEGTGTKMSYMGGLDDKGGAGAAGSSSLPGGLVLLSTLPPPNFRLVAPSWTTPGLELSTCGPWPSGPGPGDVPLGSDVPSRGSGMDTHGDGPR